MLIAVAARSKARVCGRSPTGIVGSNPVGGKDVCVLLGTGLCDGPIPRPGGLNRMCVCLTACDLETPIMKQFRPR
jgi:hypothetical protein